MWPWYLGIYAVIGSAIYGMVTAIDIDMDKIRKDGRLKSAEIAAVAIFWPCIAVGYFLSRPFLWLGHWLNERDPDMIAERLSKDKDPK